MLQLSLLPALRPLGAVPNLSLVIIVLAALYVATSEALAAAAVCGLMLDLASGANFGLWTGVLMLGTLVAGMLRRAGVELDRAMVAPVLVLLGTLMMATVIWVGLAARAAHFPGASLAGKLAIELMINLSLTVMLRPLVRLVLAGRGRQVDSGG